MRKPVQKQAVRVAVVVAVHNRLAYTREFVRSLFENTHTDFVLYVVDDGSTDGTGRFLRRHWPQVRVITGDGNLYWTQATNEGIRLARAEGGVDCVVTLNNDVVVPPDFLRNLVEAGGQHPHAIIGSQCYDIDTGCWHGSGSRRNWLLARDERVAPDDRLDVVRVTHVCARGTLYPMHVFDEVGLFDDRHLRMNGDDDLTFRAADLGWDILVSTRARHYSHIEATPGSSCLRRFSLANLRYYLFHFKSPGQLKKRFLMTRRHCRPRWYWLPSLVLDVGRVVGGYFRRTLLTGARRSEVPKQAA